MIVHNTAILDILAVRLVVIGDDDNIDDAVPRAFGNNDAVCLFRILVLALKAPLLPPPSCSILCCCIVVVCEDGIDCFVRLIRLVGHTFDDAVNAVVIPVDSFISIVV